MEYSICETCVWHDQCGMEDGVCSHWDSENDSTYMKEYQNDLDMRYKAYQDIVKDFE